MRGGRVASGLQILGWVEETGVLVGLPGRELRSAIPPDSSEGVGRAEPRDAWWPSCFRVANPRVGRGDRRTRRAPGPRAQIGHPPGFVGGGREGRAARCVVAELLPGCKSSGG